MKFSKRLQSGAALVCATFLVVAPAEAHNRKGDKLLKLGRDAESAKDYDKALDYYDQALATDPKEPAYLLPDQRIHAAASEWHVAQGRKLQQQQKINEALIEFQKAFLDDPSSQVALQEIRQTTAMVRERAAQPAGTPVLTQAERARRDLEQRISSLEGAPTLRPVTDLIRSLKMNNQPIRVLYESVGKLAGINVLFDPQGVDTVAGKNFNLDLNNVTLQEALNYIALETHTFWKPISRNAIFVTQESDPKRQEYQDEVVKVFYVQNATTQAEFTEIFNAVRTGAKLNTGMFQVASQNAIIARGTPDTISIIEKLVHDLDKPKAEVVVDVVVMEVNKNKTTTLGAALLGQGGLSRCRSCSIPETRSQRPREPVRAQAPEPAPAQEREPGRTPEPARGARRCRTATQRCHGWDIFLPRISPPACRAHSFNCCYRTAPRGFCSGPRCARRMAARLRLRSARRFRMSPAR